MDRRTALQVIGALSASPFLFTSSFEKKIITRTDPNVIPTGFSVIDAALGGGLRRGTINVIGGYHGSGKTCFAKTVAVNAARSGSVTFFNDRASYRKSRLNLNGELPLYAGLGQSHFCHDDYSRTASKYDLWVDTLLYEEAAYPSDPLYGERAKRLTLFARDLHGVAQKEDCCIVLIISFVRWGVQNVLRNIPPNTIEPVGMSYTPTISNALHHVAFNYYPSTILKVDTTYLDYSSHRESSVKQHNVKLIKNRYGGYHRQLLELDSKNLMFKPI